jgi:hypothetical protein
MEISMLVNGKIVNNMGMVFITLMMEENMKANLKRIYFMVTVCFDAARSDRKNRGYKRSCFGIYERCF